MDLDSLAAVQIHLDTHTLNRLEALAMLRREADPARSCDPEEALRQALQRGVDLLLGELLVVGHTQFSHPGPH
jgi:hypothetical protein